MPPIKRFGILRKELNSLEAQKRKCIVSERSDELKDIQESEKTFRKVVEKRNIGLYKFLCRDLIRLESRSRKSIIFNHFNELKKLKETEKTSRKDVEMLLKGYFKSIHTKRYVKDTPKNRYRETLEAKDIFGSEAHITFIVDEITKDVYECSKHGIDIVEWSQRDDKYNLVKMTVKLAMQKKCHHLKYRDTGIEDRTKDENVPIKKFKEKNLLKYVESNSTRDIGPLGEPSESSEYLDLVSKSRIPLRDYQLNVVKWMMTHRGAIVSFDVGAGKTLTSVAVSVCLLKLGKVDKVYVVAPKSLSLNFTKELKSFISDDDPLHDRYSHWTHRKFTNDFSDNPSECDGSLIIVDEAHEFRTNINPSISTGKSAFSMINCCIRAKKVMCLTATPMINEFSDIVNIVAMVKGSPPVIVPPTLSRKRELLLDIMAFRNPLEDSNGEYVDMPSRKVVTVELTMTALYYREYMKIQRSETDKSSDPFAFLTGLRHATNSIEDNPKIKWAVDRISGTQNKAKALCSFVKDGEKTECSVDRISGIRYKTIVYSSFIDDGIKIMEKKLSALDIKFSTIIGEMSSKDRDLSVSRYNNPQSGYDVMLISKAGALGLDLKGTKDVILLEGNWNPTFEEQVIGRACRIGSHTNFPKEEKVVNIFRLHINKPSMKKLMDGDMVPSADSILLSILEGKRKELDLFRAMMRSIDIDSTKADKYKDIFEKLYDEFRESKREKESPPRPEYKESTGGQRPHRPEYKPSKCPYSVLEVPLGTSEAECRNVFKKHSLRLHPDRNYNSTGDERRANLDLFKLMSSAMDFISGKDSKFSG